MSATLTYDVALSRVRVRFSAFLNTNPYFEVDASGWSASGATQGRSLVQAHEGVASLLVTPDGVTAAGGVTATRVAVTGGMPYVAQFWVYSPGGWSDLRPAVDWYTAAVGGTFISTSLGSGFSVPAGVWTLLSVPYTAPATAGGAAVRARHGGTPGTSAIYYVDEVGLMSAVPDVVSVERSVDQVRWTTARGGVAVPVIGGKADLDDYEFTPGVANYYRVRGVETGAVAFVAAGAAATGNNASVTPALPAGLLTGDLLVCLASIRNSGVGTVTAPAGWTVMRQLGNVSLLGRRFTDGDVAPVINFAGGVAGADTLAQVAAWRRADLVPVTGLDLLNPSAQDIPYPALTVPADGMAILYAAWKQATWTSVATLAGATEIGEPTSVLGSGASMVWDYAIQTTKANISSGSFVVTGGVAAISRGAAVALQHAPWLNEQVVTLTPVLTSVWLKSVSRPFLNQTISLGGHDFQADRQARGSIHEAVGRSLPIAVTDVRGSRRYTLTIRTTTLDAADALEYILASGDVLYIHAPAGRVVPVGAYLRVGDTQERRGSSGSEVRWWTVPVTEVAAPGPDVVGRTSSWQTVLNAQASWTGVIATYTSWADLLTRVAPASEVITA